ncbi:MAG: IS200/IS605 family transposase [Bacteroidetes bacterium]|nr:IS200/IS605 family transposase [Bacteroidota bacterium]
MAHSLSKLYVHIIFHTKYNQNIIGADVEEELFAYIGGIINANQSQSIKINGIENHIHILAVMPKNIALAKFVEEIKRNSSRWMKTKGKQYRNFAWQGGYAGFSVSQSVVERVKKYIENQKAHHKKQTFKVEYKKFLKKHQIEYDEKYLWTE